MSLCKPVRAGAALALVAFFPSVCLSRPSPAPSTQPAGKPSVAASAAPAPPAEEPARRLTRGEYIAREALSYRGAPYRRGGTSRSGIDCSGLALKAHRKWGLALPRTSVEQFKRGKPVAKKDLKPGDLVFFRNTYKRGISHVGIYVGNGKFVHASGKGRGVRVTPLSSPYHVKHYAGARRIALDKEPIKPASVRPPAPAEAEAASGPDQPAS